MKTTFFTDRDLGKIFPRRLKENGIDVIRHADCFKDNVTDEEWLLEAGTKGWYCLSHDRRIRYNPKEKEAVISSNVGLFLLMGHTTNLELAENFIVTFHKIEKFINNHTRPFIAKIYKPSQIFTKPGNRRSGDVKLWL